LQILSAVRKTENEMIKIINKIKINNIVRRKKRKYWEK
jgi:hypothetical protein